MTGWLSDPEVVAAQSAHDDAQRAASVAGRAWRYSDPDEEDAARAVYDAALQAATDASDALNAALYAAARR